MKSPSPPPVPAAPPPPPAPPQYGQDMPGGKKGTAGQSLPSPSILGAALTPGAGQTGQKSLIGQ